MKGSLFSLAGAFLFIAAPSIAGTFEIELPTACGIYEHTSHTHTLQSAAIPAVSIPEALAGARVRFRVSADLGTWNCDGENVTDRPAFIHAAITDTVAGVTWVGSAPVDQTGASSTETFELVRLPTSVGATLEFVTSGLAVLQVFTSNRASSPEQGCVSYDDHAVLTIDEVVLVLYTDGTTPTHVASWGATKATYR